MAAQATEMFSKLLTETDIKKRLAIPSKILPSFPAFNGSHGIKIHLMYGTRVWPIDCSVRRKGYKKPVFSGGLRRDFVIGNKLNDGDRISKYKVQGSLYRVEVVKEKPAATAICNRKVRNKRKQAPDGTMKQEGSTSIMEPAHVATHTFVDPVIAKPSVWIFGAMVLLSSMTDEKAHFNIEMKCFGFITEEACPDQKLSLELVLGQPTPYAGGVKLDLNLAPPIAD